MKKLIFLFLFSLSISISAQITSVQYQKYPVFEACSSAALSDLENCFNQTLQEFVFKNFKVPSKVAEENYKGRINILFEVTKEGRFKVLYVEAMYDELKAAAHEVFEKLPQIQPATYNGVPTYVQFTLPVAIPLVAPGESLQEEEILSNDRGRQKLSEEYDAIEKLPYANEEYRSNINIPLSHDNYSRFDAAMNRVGLNNHTAQKPYVYSEVNKYYNFDAHNAELTKERSSWFGRKWWNEHMVTIKGKDYWLTLDPGVDLQAGRDFDADLDTYNNTRLVYTQGGIGKQIGFFGVIYESQGRFADYFNRYAESIRPAGGNPAIIPGRGIAKEFKTDSYDYPLATGHVSYTPSKYFNLQLGHGKIFIGDGYRSLFSSDNASPYPYFKINTTFWKLKYTNTWTSLRDVRDEVTENGSYRTKYMASHYLSYNITKRLNLGFFESVLWQNDNDRGFDLNYLNPVIFYHSIEFSTGSRGGNALIGLSAKYKVNDRVNVYGQFIIDEFSSKDVFSGNGSYKNKTGYQLGLKYYDAFGLKNLYLQTEYNRVRPYTYSHNKIVLNYGHNNQALAHTLGANFSEFIALARYHHGRFYGSAKVIVAKRGFDFNTADNSSYYGGDIYRSEYDRVSEVGNNVAQGNTTNFFHSELQAGYLINPATSLKVYGSVILRNFDPTLDTETVYKTNTTWVNFGVRTDLFNWYYDF